jgi:hypothetical protein
VIAVLALSIAVLALVLSSIGVMAAAAWRRDRINCQMLAERLESDARMEILTAQTLSAMHDVARRYYRSQDSQ